jgi:hypothetical protein
MADADCFSYCYPSPYRDVILIQSERSSACSRNKSMTCALLYTPNNFGNPHHPTKRHAENALFPSRHMILHRSDRSRSLDSRSEVTSCLSQQSLLSLLLFSDLQTELAVSLAAKTLLLERTQCVQLFLCGLDLFRARNLDQISENVLLGAVRHVNRLCPRAGRIVAGLLVTTGAGGRGSTAGRRDFRVGKEDSHQSWVCLCGSTIESHGNGRVVEFQTDEFVAPELSGTHVAAIDFGSEAHVDTRDFLGENCCAGTETDGEELCVFMSIFCGWRRVMLRENVPSAMACQ